MAKFCACLLAFSIPFILLSNAEGQAPKGRVSEDSPTPPVTYHGLVPGLSTEAEVRETLGEPAFEAAWYAYKLLYPSEGRQGMFDSIHTSSKGGDYACCEAASIPEGYASRKEIEMALGRPEYEVRMATFSLLDYSEKGVRFIVDAEDKPIGVAYFPPFRRNMEEQGRAPIDLSKLRQGPQPKPKDPAVPEGLTLGVSEAKISPVTSGWVNPAYRDRYKVHDDLFARCAVFEKGGLTVALVGADLFGMSYSDIEPMIDRVREKGVEHFVLAMSHTHSGQDTIGVYGFYPAEYIAFIQDQIVAGVAEAQSKLEAVKELRVASKELPMDGARVMGYIRNARNPGILDPTLSVVQAIGEDDKPIATLVNFACHPEGLETSAQVLSADFPGSMCYQIRRDGGGQPVFLNGALGGMVSGDSRARTFEETEKMGLGFAAMVKDLLATAQPPEKFEFTAETRKIEIPMTNERFLPLYGEKRPLSQGNVVTEMTYVTLGEAQIVTLPGEVLPEISFEIQEKMTGFPRILVGLANDELGYIIPQFDFRPEEYEESMSQGPGAGPVVRDTAIEMISGSVKN
jgi:hypothetical protein